MANELAIFSSGAMPAHVAAANDALANITPRKSINALSFEGKVWTINLDGTKTKLMRTNAEGEEEAVQIFTGVIVGYNSARGREFYGKPYDPKNPTIPDCWSEDSVAPHANCQTPVSKTCAACPNSKKGSAQTQQGGATTACGAFQKLAIIPAAKVGSFPPLRLRMKITSIYDKDGENKHPGWYAWTQYLDLLTAKGVRSTGLLPTKIKFDKDTAYPKLLFSPGKDWLDLATQDVVKEIMLSDEVKDLLAETYDPTRTNTGNKPLPEDDGEETEVAAAVPAQAQPKPKAKAAPAPAAEAEEEGEGDEVVIPTSRAAPAPAPAPAKPKAKPAPAPVVEAEEEGEGEEVVLTAEQQAKALRDARAQIAADAAAKTVAKAAKTAKAAVQTEEEGEGEETVVVAPVKPKANGAAAPGKAAKTAAAPAKGAPLNAPPDVADLLGNWDD